MRNKCISILVIMATLLSLFSFGATMDTITTAGDVNNDGKINSRDSHMLRCIIANVVTDGYDEVVADCSGDGKIDAKDSLLLRQYIARYPVALEPLPEDDNGEWLDMYTWEDVNAGDTTNYVIPMNNSMTAAVEDLDSNPVIPESEKALGITCNTQTNNPTIGSYSLNVRLDTDLTERATNLRTCLQVDLDESRAQVVNIGIKIKTDVYYYKLTIESYDDFHYFYFVGKTFTLQDDQTIQKVIEKTDIPNIREIEFWIEGEMEQTLLVDDIEYYTGRNGYDSSAEDALLPQPEAPVDDGTDKYIAFSFDDGPTTKNMEALLDVLDKYDAKASFFLIGQNIKEDAKDVMNRAVNEGHELANHTWSHPYMTQLTEEQMKEQLQKTEDLIKEYTGVTTNLVRLPYVAQNGDVMDVLEQEEYYSIAGYCPNDWSGTSVDYKVDYIKKHCGNGSIVLLHDTMATNAQTLDILIPYYQSMGYECVTVSDLFVKQGVTPDYWNTYNYVR